MNIKKGYVIFAIIISICSSCNTNKINTPSKIQNIINDDGSSNIYYYIPVGSLTKMSLPLGGEWRDYKRLWDSLVAIGAITFEETGDSFWGTVYTIGITEEGTKIFDRERNHPDKWALLVGRKKIIKIVDYKDLDGGKAAKVQFVYAINQIGNSESNRLALNLLFGGSLFSQNVAIGEPYYGSITIEKDESKWNIIKSEYTYDKYTEYLNKEEREECINGINEEDKVKKQNSGDTIPIPSENSAAIQEHDRLSSNIFEYEERIPGKPRTYRQNLEKYQKRLADLGYLELKDERGNTNIDGYYGDIMKAAVSKYQKATGLKVTGNIDGYTARSLGINE